MQGGQASPFDAWNGLRGIRTLVPGPPAGGPPPRGWPSTSRRTRRVAGQFYPGLDSHPQRDLAKRQMATGGPCWPSRWPAAPRRRRRFCEACRLARIALSLGGPETLVTHPATIAAGMTPAERAELGITDGLVRMSVGLEHLADLIADLDQALAAAG